MDATQKEEGDALAKLLIQEYWDTLTGSGSTWNFYLWPLRYTPRDRWATREQWISAAKQCIERKTRMLTGLDILLAEGFTEYLDTAVKHVGEWSKRYHRPGDPEEYFDPAEYYDIIKYFPPDNAIRREFLCAGDPDGLSEEERAALISIEDEHVCRQLAASIATVFTAHSLDEDQAENYALPRMMELGRLCTKYLDPAVMELYKEAIKALAQLVYSDSDGDLKPGGLFYVDHDGGEKTGSYIWRFERGEFREEQRALFKRDSAKAHQPTVPLR